MKSIIYSYAAKICVCIFGLLLEITSQNMYLVFEINMNLEGALYYIFKMSSFYKWLL